MHPALERGLGGTAETGFTVDPAAALLDLLLRLDSDLADARDFGRGRLGIVASGGSPPEEGGNSAAGIGALTAAAEKEGGAEERSS